MTEVGGFRGIRYAASDISSLLAPPYDVVDVETQRGLLTRDSLNILAVDNPISGLAPELWEGAYRSAGQTLNGWLTDGLLVQDETMSMYVVSHGHPSVVGSGSARRLGIIALVEALPWGPRSIRPHEITFRGPKEDRLRLMRSTNAQTSPIFAVWDGEPELGRILQDMAGSAPACSGTFRGEVGEESIALWRVGDESLVSRLVALLSQATLYIADGHHRYETAVTFADGRVGSGVQPGVLTYLSDARDPSLCLLPTHRLIRMKEGRSPRSTESAARILGDGWSWRRMAPDRDPSATGLQVHGDMHGFLVASSDGVTMVTRRPVTSPSPRDGLDVQILHTELLPAFGVSDDSATISFTRDDQLALGSVAKGDADLAFVLAAPSVMDVLRVADAGETMPQKSTYFYPKVPTGLVLYRMEGDRGTGD